MTLLEGKNGVAGPKGFRKDTKLTREVIEEAPIELGHFHFSWHIPELRHPDVPPRKPRSDAESDGIRRRRGTLYARRQQ